MHPVALSEVFIMKVQVKREVIIGLQYLVMLLLALVVAFFAELPSGGSGDGELILAISLMEEWSNVAPYAYQVLAAFAALGAARLAIIIMVYGYLNRTR